jgi:altronate hydrolase
MTASILRLAPDDDVVVALRKLDPGETIEVEGRPVTVRDAVPFAHKLAIADLASGRTVRKFGVPIGSTTRAVAAGEHVHVHNLKSDYIVNAEDFFEGEA